MKTYFHAKNIKLCQQNNRSIYICDQQVFCKTKAISNKCCLLCGKLTLLRFTLYRFLVSKANFVKVLTPISVLVSSMELFYWFPCMILCEQVRGFKISSLLTSGLKYNPEKTHFKSTSVHYTTLYSVPYICNSLLLVIVKETCQLSC